VAVDIIPELTVYTITASFKDADGLATTPADVTYSVTDALTGGAVIPSTAVVAAAGKVIITIPANKNVCMTPDTLSERRSVVITAAGLVQKDHVYQIARVPAP